MTKWVDRADDILGPNAPPFTLNTALAHARDVDWLKAAEKHLKDERLVAFQHIATLARMVQKMTYQRAWDIHRRSFSPGAKHNENFDRINAPTGKIYDETLALAFASQYLADGG